MYLAPSARGSGHGPGARPPRRSDAARGARATAALLLDTVARWQPAIATYSGSGSSPRPPIGTTRSRTPASSALDSGPTGPAGHVGTVPMSKTLERAPPHPQGSKLGTLLDRLEKVHGDRQLVTEADDGLSLTYAQAAKRVRRWAGGIAGQDQAR